MKQLAIGVLMLGLGSQAFAMTTDQCISDAAKLAPDGYTGKLNIGTAVWPGYDYAAFSIQGSWISLSCKVAGCVDEGGNYGGGMTINSCTENAKNIVVTMSGTAVTSAKITIPKGKAPAPNAEISVVAEGGINPASDHGTFVPFSF